MKIKDISNMFFSGLIGFCFAYQLYNYLDHTEDKVIVNLIWFIVMIILLIMSNRDKASD